MKDVHILWIAFLAVAITLGTARGQDGGDRHQRIEALKVSFFTEQLDLTTDEAQAFWPVFNKFEDERRTLRKNYKKGPGEQPRLEFMDDAEAEAMIRDELEFQQKDLDLTRKYIAEFKKILPVKKVAVLLTLEKKFGRMILERLRKGGMDGPPGRN